MQCSWLRFMARHSSGKFVNTVFFVPSRATYDSTTCCMNRAPMYRSCIMQSHGWLPAAGCLLPADIRHAAVCSNKQPGAYTDRSASGCISAPAEA